MLLRMVNTMDASRLELFISAAVLARLCGTGVELTGVEAVELLEEIQRLRCVVAYYADKENWSDSEDYNGKYQDLWNHFENGYDKAREALNDPK